MGEEFLLRGHRIAGDKGAVADGSKFNFGEYFSFSSKFRFDASSDTDPSTKFNVESLSIYTGGPITDKFSYFVEFYLHETDPFANADGSKSSSATRTKLADAYLQWASNPDGDSFWYARAGQVYPYLIYTASSGGRLSVSRPLAINEAFGTPATTLFTLRDREYGVTGGFVDTAQGLRFEAGVMNGGGTNKRPNLQEKNNNRELFITAQKTFDAHGSALGAYFARGSFRTLPSPPSILDDEFTRFAVLGQFVRDRYVLSGGYVWGNDDLLPTNPRAYYVEGGYNINPDLTAYARWDSMEGKDGSAGTTSGPTIGISRRIPHIGRLAVEYQAMTHAGTTSDLFRTELNWLF